MRVPGLQTESCGSSKGRGGHGFVIYSVFPFAYVTFNVIGVHRVIFQLRRGCIQSTYGALSPFTRRSWII